MAAPTNSTAVPTATRMPTPTWTPTAVPTPIPTPSPTKRKNPFDASSIEWPEIGTTTQVNAFLFVLLLGLFELKRAGRRRHRVYAPRWYYYRNVKKRLAGRAPSDDGSDLPAIDTAPRARALFRDGKLYLLPCALLWSLWTRRLGRWIVRVARTPDDEMRRMIGLDAFLLLRFCRMWKRLFFWGSVLGCACLLPVYATGRNEEKGFYRLTMRNLKTGAGHPPPPRLWAPVCFVYAFSALVVRALERESRAYLKLRRDFLAGVVSGSSSSKAPTTSAASPAAAAAAVEDPEAYQARCSVVVERVPSRLRSDRALKAYFERVVGGAVAAVVYLDLRDLEAKIRRRDRAWRVLRRRLFAASRAAAETTTADGTGDDHQHAVPQERVWTATRGGDDDVVDPRDFAMTASGDDPSPTTQSARWCCFWTRVDAVRYRSAQLDALDAAVVDARDRALADEGTALGAVGDETSPGFLAELFARRDDAELQPDYFFDAESPFAWIWRLRRRYKERRLFRAAASERAAAAPSAPSFSMSTDEMPTPTTTTTTTSFSRADDGNGAETALLGGGDAAPAPLSTTEEGDGAIPATPTTTNAGLQSILEASTSFVGTAARATARTVVRQAADVTTGLATTLALDDALMTRSYERSSTGVVTFASPGLAADVAQLALTSEARGLEASLAPPVSDVSWRNVGVSLESIELRGLLADAWLWVLAVLWTPLIVFFQTLSNLQEVARVLPFLEPFVRKKKYEYARSLVTGYLPVILLLGLLALIPIFLEWVALRYVGLKSHAAVQRWVLSRNFYFQLLSVFVTVLAGSISSTLKAFIKKPNSLLKLLGKSLPNISAYFMQTLVTKVLFSLSNELSRPLPYFLSSARSKFDKYIAPILVAKRGQQSGDKSTAASGSKASGGDSAKTTNGGSSTPPSPEDDDAPAFRHEEEPARETTNDDDAEDSDDPEDDDFDFDLATWRPPEFRIGTTGVEFLLVVLIGLTYAPIAPLILVLAFLFFVFAETVFAHQFLFVYVNNFEAGGLYLWPALTFFTTLSLIVSQLTVISYLGALNGVKEAPALAPVPFVTAYFYSRIVRFYELPGQHLDRETAAKYDLRHDGSTPARAPPGLEDAAAEGVLLQPDRYRHPALTVPSVTSDMVKRDCERISSASGASALRRRVRPLRSARRPKGPSGDVASPMHASPEAPLLQGAAHFDDDGSPEVV